MKRREPTKRLLPLAALPVILLVCLSLWAGMEESDSVSVDSHAGVWDLSNVDFATNNALLVGHVEYIPDALLTPEEFAAREDEAIHGDTGAEDCATSRIRLLLPEDGWYTFDRISIDFSQRLFINGEWMLDVGIPGESRASSVPDTARITFTARPVDGVIEIVQQSSNFVHREGGNHAAWVIGGPALLTEVRRVDFTANIILGCYLALFVLHALFFFMLRGYRANLYFALFCLMWFLRTGVTGTKVFSALLPWLDWYAKFRIEYISVPVSAALTVAVIAALFPGVLQKPFLRGTYFASAAFGILFLFAGTEFMSRAILVCEGVYAAAIIYVAIRFAMRLRSINLEQCVFLTGAALFLYAALRDFLYHNRIMLPPFTSVGGLTQAAMLIFVFFEMVSVFIATMKEVRRQGENEQRLIAENAALDRVNALKTDLMRTISHELRTPLAVMMGYAEIMAEDGRKNGMSAEAVSDLDVIAAESRRLADLVEEMRTFTLAREYSKDRQAISAETIIRQIAGLYAHVLEQKGRVLTLDVAEGLPPVSGNDAELTQVIFNLLRNADVHAQSDVTIHAEFTDGLVRVAVSDTGTGIAPELLPHVFERGVHGESGTGFGLAICRDIITAYDGEIGIGSEPGRGTTVFFTLPPYVDAKGGEVDV